MLYFMVRRHATYYIVYNKQHLCLGDTRYEDSKGRIINRLQLTAVTAIDTYSSADIHTELCTEYRGVCSRCLFSLFLPRIVPLCHTENVEFPRQLTTEPKNWSTITSLKYELQFWAPYYNVRAYSIVPSKGLHIRPFPQRSRDNHHHHAIDHRNCSMPTKPLVHGLSPNTWNFCR
jgi:hypothetical protein